VTGKKKEDQKGQVVDSNDEEFTFEKVSLNSREKTMSTWEMFASSFTILCYMAVVGGVIFAGTVVFQILSAVVMFIEHKAKYGP